QTDEAGEAAEEGRPLRLGQRAAFRQPGQQVTDREALDLFQEGLAIRLAPMLRSRPAMVMCGGREGRHTRNPGEEAEPVARQQAEFERRRDHDDAFDRYSEVGMQPVGECGDAEAAITFSGENGRREPALVAGEIEADEGAERIEILFRLPERGGVALRRLLALLVFGTDAPAVARADRVDEDEIREGEPGFVVLYQRSRIGRDAAAFAELYAAR